MSVLLLPLTSLSSLDNSARPRVLSNGRTGLEKKQHVLFHAVDVEKNMYMCVYMWVCSLCPWKPEDGIRFPINLIDWMTRKYPGSLCVLGFYCHDKTLTQSNLVMKGFISFYSLQSIIEGSQCRNWRQGLMQRLWSNTVYWPVPCSLLSLLSCITWDHHCSTTHNELDPPISVINQENSPQALSQTSLSHLRIPLSK